MAKNCENRAAVVDVIAKEQFIETLPEEVRVWVKERKPRTTQVACRLAEDYRQARKVELWPPLRKLVLRKECLFRRVATLADNRDTWPRTVAVSAAVVRR